MSRPLRVALLLAATLGSGASAFAQGPTPDPTASAGAAAPRAAAQGVAVVGAGNARDTRDEAFTLARAVYASRLRPAALDEARARILAGDPPPENAVRDVKELAELRAGVAGDDAASRRLLSGIADQLGVKAILVVRVGQGSPGVPAARPEADGGSEEGTGGGAAQAVRGPVLARLFLAETGELDAARYLPEPGVDGPLAWRATVASLERRLGSSGPAAAVQPAPAPAPVRPEEGARPFYASTWFWAAVGGAALVGGAVFFAARDTSSDSIHLQMRVP